MSKFFIFVPYLYVILNVVHASSYYDYASRYYGFQQNQYSVHRPCSANLKITAVTYPLGVGKTPFWDSKERSVYTVDIINCTAIKYNVDTGELNTIKIGTESIAAIIPAENKPNTFLISQGDKIGKLYWNPKTGEAKVDLIISPDLSRPYTNHFTVADTKVHPDGSVFFWYTFIDAAATPDQIPPDRSTIYSIRNKKQKVMADHFVLGDGFGFGKDGKLYYCDTLANLTYVTDYDQESRCFKNTKVLLDYSTLKINGQPDGMTLDQNGNLWIACPKSNKVIHVDSRSGEVICSIDMPCLSPTDITFVGCPNSEPGDMSCMVVTSDGFEVPSSEKNKFDGTMMMVQGLPPGIQGVPSHKVNMDHIV